VDDVALAVKHDVAVVSIFELQQERQQAVSGHAHYEVPPRLHANHQPFQVSASKHQGHKMEDGVLRLLCMLPRTCSKSAYTLKTCSAFWLTKRGDDNGQQQSRRLKMALGDCPCIALHCVKQPN